MERGLDEFIKYIDLIGQSLDTADFKINKGLNGCSFFWFENIEEISSTRDNSKLELTHFVVVNRSEEVIKFANDKIEGLLKREEIFRIDNKGFIDDYDGSKGFFLFEGLFHIDKNWFLALNLEVVAYNYWFKDLVGNIKNNAIGEEIKPNEKHLNIFKNNGFVLFNHLFENYKTKAMKTDISYFYRAMDKDDYIKVGEAEFKRWIKAEYNIDISKIKTDLDTMDNFYKARQDNYNIGLERFKSQLIEKNKIGTKAE